MEQLRFMIDFEGIKIDNLLGFLKPGLTVKSIITNTHETTKMEQTLISSGFEEANIYINFISQYGVFAVAGLLFSIPMFLLSRIKPLQRYIVKKAKTFYQGMLWSGAIRSITFSYLNLCLYILVYSSTNDISDTNIEGLLTVIIYNYILLVYPFIIIYIISVNGPSVMQRQFAKERMKALVA